MSTVGVSQDYATIELALDDEATLLEFTDAVHESDTSTSLGAYGANVTFQPKSGAGHDGVSWTAGARIVWDANSHIFSSSWDSDITMNDMIVQSAPGAGDASNEIIRTGENITCTWTRCMLGPDVATGTESAYSQVDSTSTHIFRNCLIKGFARSAASDDGALMQGNSNAYTLTIEHCTIDIVGGLLNGQNRSHTVNIKGSVIKCGDNTGWRNISGAATMNVVDTITNFDKPNQTDTDTNNDWDPNTDNTLFSATTTDTDVLIAALPSTYPDGDYQLVEATGGGSNLALDNATAGVVADDIVGTSRSETNDDSGCFELVAASGSQLDAEVTFSASASLTADPRAELSGAVTLAGSATLTADAWAELHPQAIADTPFLSPYSDLLLTPHMVHAAALTISGGSSLLATPGGEFELTSSITLDAASTLTIGGHIERRASVTLAGQAGFGVQGAPESIGLTVSHSGQDLFAGAKIVYQDATEILVEALHFFSRTPSNPHSDANWTTYYWIRAGARISSGSAYWELFFWLGYGSRADTSTNGRQRPYYSRVPSGITFDWGSGTQDISLEPGPNENIIGNGQTIPPTVVEWDPVANAIFSTEFGQSYSFNGSKRILINPNHTGFDQDGEFALHYDPAVEQEGRDVWYVLASRGGHFLEMNGKFVRGDLQGWALDLRSPYRIQADKDDPDYPIEQVVKNAYGDGYTWSNGWRHINDQQRDDSGIGQFCEHLVRSGKEELLDFGNVWILKGYAARWLNRRPDPYNNHSRNIFLNTYDNDAMRAKGRQPWVGSWLWRALTALSTWRNDADPEVAELRDALLVRTGSIIYQLKQDHAANSWLEDRGSAVAYWELGHYWQGMWVVQQAIIDLTGQADSYIHQMMTDFATTCYAKTYDWDLGHPHNLSDKTYVGTGWSMEWLEETENLPSSYPSTSLTGVMVGLYEWLRDNNIVSGTKLDEIISKYASSNYKWHMPAGGGPILAAVTLGGSASLTVSPRATLAASFSASGTATLTASPRDVGAVGMTLSSLSISASGEQATPGSAAMTLPASSISATGTQSMSGAASMTLPPPVITAAGAQAQPGAIAMVLPMSTITAAGATGDFTGAIDMTLPMLTLAGVGEQVTDGAGVLTLPMLTLTAAGVMVPEGAAALSLPPIVIVGSGVAGGVGGAGALVLPPLSISGSGAQIQSGAISMALPALTVAGTGSLAISGSIAMALPALTIAAVGNIPPVGAVSMALPAIVLVGSGSVYGSGGPYQQLSDRVRAYFIAQVATPEALDVAYDNQEHTVSNGLWSRFRLEHSDTDLVAWGHENVYRQRGLARLEIRAPAMSGEQAARQVADAFVTGLRGAKFGGVTYGTPGRAGAARREDAWWVMEYVCPFRSEFTEARVAGAVKTGPVTRENLWTTIAERFQDEVEVGLGVPVLFDDFSFAGTQNATWVRLTITDGNGFLVDSAKTYRTPGLATAQVFARALSGTQDQIQVIDTIATAFRAVSVEGVAFSTPTVQTVGATGRLGRRDSWWQANVVCPFNFHETVST